jgi:hypothetical protein
MTAGNIGLLVLGIAMAIFAVWALWPHRRSRPGPKNNWRQRGGEEAGSARNRGPDFDSPYLSAWGDSSD